VMKYAVYAMAETQFRVKETSPKENDKAGN
jgi:hypothetical protein